MQRRLPEERLLYHKTPWFQKSKLTLGKNSFQEICITNEGLFLNDEVGLGYFQFQKPKQTAPWWPASFFFLRVFVVLSTSLLQVHETYLLYFPIVLLAYKDLRRMGFMAWSCFSCNLQLLCLCRTYEKSFWWNGMCFYS